LRGSRGAPFSARRLAKREREPDRISHRDHASARHESPHRRRRVLPTPPNGADPGGHPTSEHGRAAAGALLFPPVGTGSAPTPAPDAVAESGSALHLDGAPGSKARKALSRP